MSKPPSQGFYSKLNEHLVGMDFARRVWALCEPAYREESRGGRPGIDPVIYFKMLLGLATLGARRRAVASKIGMSYRQFAESAAGRA